MTKLRFPFLVTIMSRRAISHPTRNCRRKRNMEALRRRKPWLIWSGKGLSPPRKVVLMPTGPKDERRPADVIGNAVKVMRILSGEEPEDYGDGAS